MDQRRRPPVSKRAGQRPSPPPPKRPPFGLVRIILGSILVAAGALKLYELGFEALDSGSAALLLIVFAEFELLGGLWMLSGLEPERTRRWSVGVFAGLALASLFQALSGKCSCGCFGAFSPSPWFVLVFDLLAVALLVWSRLPAGLEEVPLTSPMSLVGMGTLALVVGIGGWGQADLVTLAGTATAGGRPLQDAELKFTGESGRFVLRTDGEGRFRLPLLRPGEYAVSAPGSVVTGPIQTPGPADRGRRKAQYKGQSGRGRMPAPAAPAEPVMWIELPSCPREDLAITF